MLDLLRQTLVIKKEVCVCVPQRAFRCPRLGCKLSNSFFVMFGEYASTKLKSKHTRTPNGYLARTIQTAAPESSLPGIHKSEID